MVASDYKRLEAQVAASRDASACCSDFSASSAAAICACVA